jgi:hypothetical protein
MVSYCRSPRQGMALVWHWYFTLYVYWYLIYSYSGYRVRGSAELNDFPKKAQPGCSMSSVLNRHEVSGSACHQNLTMFVYIRVCV